MNINNQLICTSLSHELESSVRKRRFIKKAEKCNRIIKASRRGYCYAGVRNNARLNNHSKIKECSCGQPFDILPSIYSQIVDQNPSSLRKSITSIVQQFPTLSSIDELFSLSFQRSLETTVDLEYFLRYSRTCYLIDYNDANPILLSNEFQAGVAVVAKQQASKSPSFLFMALSKCQASLCQKRSIFMEKLRKNESKYDSSLGRMSQISKQLAFTYRIYLETRNQIASKLNEFLVNPSSVKGSLQSVRKKYAHLLISKNLRHTFEDCQLDQFNYFKLREYIESNRIQQFKSCSSLHQFQNFMKNRRPKRGKKFALATACSVCLSDYYQLNNPLRNCQGCGLRAHRLCYPFEHKKCGYCSYQKLKRQFKNKVDWCMICKKPSLMVMKIDELSYAHGFCLLVHGFWHVKVDYKSRDSWVQSMREECSFDPNDLGYQRCYKQEMEIEFQNPQKYTIKLQKQNRISEEQICNDEHFFDIFQPSFPHFNHFQQYNQENQEKKLQNKNNINQCKSCAAPFLNDCFIVCVCCGKKYHSLCAFLQGFKLTIYEEVSLGSQKNLPLLDCCSADYSKVRWNRRFKLNYQRCAFYMNGEQFPDRQEPKIWVDGSEGFIQ